MLLSLRTAAFAVVTLALYGCAPTPPMDAATAQPADSWCSTRSMDAYACRNAAEQEHGACVGRNDDAYDACRRLWDRGRFRFMPGFGTN